MSRDSQKCVGGVPCAVRLPVGCGCVCVGALLQPKGTAVPAHEIPVPGSSAGGGAAGAKATPVWPPPEHSGADAPPASDAESARAPPAREASRGPRGAGAAPAAGGNDAVDDASVNPFLSQ